MTRLLTATENSLKMQYYQTKHSIEMAKEKSTFIQLNEFEKEQLAQLEISLKQIKTKLILKGVEI